MGFNTVAVLYNDHTHRLESDGPIGKQIAAAMRSFASPRSRTDTWFGAGQVISQAHADGYQVVVVHGNTGSCCDDANDLGWMALDQMQRCLERHGYKVTKPKVKRVWRPA